MKLAILGGTGGTGLCLVKQALEKGHTVVAIVRNPAKISHIQHSKLHVVKGNIFSSESLQAHFENCDGVLSALGATSPYSRTTIYSESIKAIVAAMHGANVKRLIAITSWYIKVDPDDDPGFYVRYIWRTMMKNPLKDAGDMEQYLLEECQEIDYTVVRPPQLSNSASEGKDLVIGECQFAHGSTSVMPRADVAKFMLQCMGSEEYNKKFLAIGIKK